MAAWKKIDITRRGPKSKLTSDLPAYFRALRAA
jgi:hypothetical protein